MLNPRITPKYRAAVEKRVYDEAVLVGIPDISVIQRQPTSDLQATSTSTLSQPVLVQLPEQQPQTERYLEIREVATGNVVTVIEIISPKNKQSGEGRNQYLSKRAKVLDSQSHLIEIDLLRNGTPLPVNPAQTSDYRVLVSRVEQRPMAQLYPSNLREPLPCFLIPLQEGDQEPTVNLNELMQVVYEAAALDLSVDYQQQPNPSLSEEDYQWIQHLLFEKK